jgi:phage terminase large subunit-like protein
MVSNVTAKTDAKDNIYPNKEKRHLKIDGAVAAIMGMARAMTPPENGDINDWLSGGPVVAVAPKPVAKVGAR